MVDTVSPQQQIDEMAYAARVGDIEKVTSWLRRGADINGVDSDGITALTGAAAWGIADMVKVLLREGADPNLAGTDGDPPLVKAVSMINDLDTVMALLDGGADVAGVDNEGDGAYIWALRAGRKDIAEILKKRGAPVPDQIF